MQFVHKTDPCGTERVPMPQKDKKRSGKRAYLNDFHQTLSGEYVYQGATYAFDGSKKQRQHLYYKLLAIGTVMTAAGITSGSVTAPGSLNCFYVLIPYFISFIATLSLIWALCRLWAGGSPLREYVYRATVEQFRPRAVISAVAAGCALAGEIVFVLCNGTGGLVTGMILFLLGQALTVTGSMFWLRTAEACRWIKNEAPGNRA